jgi:putative ABC transport system substrate-binding protein
MTDRRMFIGTLAMGAFAVPLAARAQPPGKMPRIGFITGRRRGPGPEAFRQGLREHGWVEGQTIIIESRYAEEGRLDLLPDLTAQLVNLRVDVIVTGSEPVVLALKQATATIPIVFAMSADPVGSGLVASLARPGGNATGLTGLSPELGGKKLELLKEAVPGASRVAVLWNAAHPGKTPEFKDTQVAARALGVTLQSVEVRRPDDLPGAFSAITRGRPDALVTLTEPLTLAHQRQIVDFAAR